MRASVNGILFHPTTLHTSTAIGQLPMEGGGEDNVITRDQRYGWKELVMYQGQWLQWIN